MAVSILLPVHGECPFLVDTLSSILRQTFRGPIQLVIALDRPSEDAMKVINDFTKVEGATIVKSREAGISSALNSAISASIYPLLARLDSDDVMHEDRLKIQVEFLASNPEVAILGSQMRFIDADGNVIGRSYYPTKDADVRNLLQYRNCIGHPSVTFRKSVVDTVGIYRHEFEPAEDYDLWARVMKNRNLKFYNLTEKLTDYRKHEAQVSQTKLALQSERSLAISANIRSRGHLYGNSVVNSQLRLPRKIGNKLISRLRTELSMRRNKSSLLIMLLLIAYAILRPLESSYLLRARVRTS